jgi:hypothetical protein
VDDPGRPKVGVVHTRMVTIDDLVAQGQVPPPEMVKMDVEGSGHLVLQSAENTFAERRPHIFLEYWATCDPGLRVRRQVQRSAADSGLELLGRAGIGVSSGRPYTFFRIRTEDDHQLVDGLFLRNTERPLRDPALFEPWPDPLPLGAIHVEPKLGARVTGPGLGEDEPGRAEEFRYPVIGWS